MGSKKLEKVAEVVRFKGEIGNRAENKGGELS